ncbi:methyltransferase [Dyella japonica A8]|uniref:Methyltransferase n=1 Tax=Dyella japonica A8 TaxID=1217721 RepID=A0A075K7V1_9GAMM|nr:methyltransferase [Dyella japonica A8]
MPDYRDTLREAMEAHRANQLDRAEQLYRAVLERHATQPDALHYLGVLQHQRGLSDEGATLIQASLRVTPKHPDAHNNLGNIHKECGRLKEAEACYRQALTCSPGHHHAQNNLAIVLEAQERPEEAFLAYARLLEIAPEYAQGHYLLGLFLRNYAQNIEHVEQSVECFRMAYALDDRNLRALEGMGISLYALNRREEAAQVYRDWLGREPDNPIPRHMLASCGGAETPPRADDAYVRNVFDGFADSFDEQLLKNLGYRAPQVLMETMAAVLNGPNATLHVLDAGCGTGLCGPLLSPYAAHLVGVDLSPGMVEKARARGGYDELAVAELTAYLERHPQQYDLVLSADTLVYFGDLQQVVAAAHAALRPGGWLGFTLEALEALDAADDRVELTPSGRYRHSRRHVQRVLDDAGFTDARIEGDVLRREGGQPVRGWVVRARRASA